MATQVTTSTVKCGIPKYDNEIFPKVEKGEVPYNWIAGFFAPFWLPYKGLWREFFTWSVPYALASGFAEAMHMNALYLGLSIGMVIGVGKVANKKYYEKIKLDAQSKSNVMAGVGGLVVNGLIVVFLSSFATGFLGGFKSAYNKQANNHRANTNNQQAEAARAPAAAVEYTQSSMAVMDGDNAIGKTLKFGGMYMGVQTIQDTPVLLVSDAQAGTQWWVTFSDEHRASIAQMRVGSSYMFECVISEIATAMNVCALK